MMRSRSCPDNLVRGSVRRLHAYVPGEQPKVPGLIKLNTNENPYPPSPKVLAAVRRCVDGRLRLYPDPVAQALRERLAALHGCRPESIIVGNGSDELLALATRAFVEPGRRREPRSLVQYLVPSYSLYPVLADIHGALRRPVRLTSDFGLPSAPGGGSRGGGWESRAALSFITTPNAPTGRGYRLEDLDRLCRSQRGVVLLDEAYVDFAPGHALALALRHPHVLVARTFSKAYSLCFQRVGYLVGHPALIGALDKIRDSYNVNGLGQVAALATLDDLPYYRRNFARIIATREQVAVELARLGFEVSPSQTNFLLVRPPRFAAEVWLARLRRERILVRWFDQPGLRDRLRVTIGAETEMEKFLGVAEKLLRS